MTDNSPMDEYRAPAVDRAIAILDAIEGYRDGLSLQALADACEVPKSTVYRILNSLIAANIVRRIPATGTYVLGTRLLGYAANVVSGVSREDLIRFARPHLERLTNLTGEATKLSILDGDTALCIDVVPGTNSFSVAPIVGRRWPLHTGGAGKLLLASSSPKHRADYIAKGVAVHTARTLADGAALEAELERIAAAGWAEDRGEHISSVSALAAPIHDAGRNVVAAVSLAYFSDLHAGYRERFVEPVRRCAEAISAELASGPDAANEGPAGRETTGDRANHH